MYPISKQTQVYGRTLIKLSFPRNHGQSMIGFFPADWEIPPFKKIEVQK